IEHGATAPIDLYAELQRMVLDYAAHSLFSEKLSEEQLDWIVPATNFAEIMFATLTPYWIPSPSNLKFRRIRKRYHGLMDEIIRKHRQTADSYLDIVRYL